MRAWIYRQMSKPWVARVTLGVSLAACMLGLRWLVHVVAAQGHVPLFLFALVFFPVLFAFAFWWDRKGY